MSDDQPLIPNPPRVALTDPRTGLITPEWYRWILRLMIRVGGPHAPNLDELERQLRDLENEVRVAPPEIPPIFPLDALLAPTTAATAAPEAQLAPSSGQGDTSARDAAQLAALAPMLVLHLQSELLHVRAEVAELRRTMDDFMKGPSPWQ